VPIEFAAPLLRQLARLPGLDPIGIHVHLGSQIVDVEPLGRAARALADLAIEVRAAGVPLRHIDLGGGLGVAYDGQTAAVPAAYAAAVLPAIRETGLHLIVEPGRFLVATAGALVGRVADTKAYAGSPRFAVLDTGMTELIRPMLYEAFHRIVAVTPRPGPEDTYEIVGPLCETSDTLGHERRLGPIEVGDLLAVLDAGAYGFVMASNYNRRRFPAEVLVDEGQWRVIRRRQTYDDQFRNEQD
jgi:diaminopimelate decarboxylase